MHSFKKKHKRYYYQPGIGVKADIETLLQRFSAAGTVRYEKFAEIWKEMKFSLYCAGRQTQREAREFVEECFHVAVQYWLPPSSFLVRTGASYLLYGLYHFQLVSPRVKIRITQEDWGRVKEFHSEAREQQHLDLDYVFQKLIVSNAFHFVATPTELYPSFKEKEEHDLIIPDSLKEESDMVEEIFSEPLLGQLELFHDQYQKMKAALDGEDRGPPDSSLDIVHRDLIQGIRKTLQTHQQRQRTARHIVELPEDQDDWPERLGEQESPNASMRKGLKRKAYNMSMGYFKPYRKGPRKSSDEAGDSSDKELLSPEKKKGRGREQIVELYEKDEVEQGPVKTSIAQVYSMPNLDLIVPNLPDKAVIEEEGHAVPLDKKVVMGKGPLKCKGALKKTKTKQVQESSDSLCKLATNIDRKSSRQNIRKKSAKSDNKSDTGSPKQRKMELSKTIGGKTDRASKPSLKVNLKATKTTKTVAEGDGGKSNRLTAQEILFQSLRLRNKQKQTKKKKK